MATKRITNISATSIDSQRAGAKMTPDERKKFLIRLMHKQHKEALESEGARAQCEVCRSYYGAYYVKLCVAPVAFREPMMVCGKCRFEAGKGRFPIAK